MWREKATSVLLVLVVLGGVGCSSELRYAPGVIAPKSPVQEAVYGVPEFTMSGYTIRPVARFEVEARVLGVEHYRFDRVADLSPVDLALGWGPMSDQAVLDEIDISQGGRFYRWHVKEYPIPRRAIIEHSANMHMIPLSEAVRKDLLKVRDGEIVRLRGYLVVAHAKNGGVWKSSLTRKDTGNGACEVVVVEEIMSYPGDMMAHAF